jgi:hypothetical protein
VSDKHNDIGKPPDGDYVRQCRHQACDCAGAGYWYSNIRIRCGVYEGLWCHFWLSVFVVCGVKNPPGRVAAIKMMGALWLQFGDEQRI